MTTSKPSKQRGKKVTSSGSRRKQTTSTRVKKSPTDVAISRELAPAVAIALLQKTEQLPGAAPPALDCLAAGAARSDEDGKVRVQLLFENGTVLPVEMSNAAGVASPRDWQTSFIKTRRLALANTKYSSATAGRALLLPAHRTIDLPSPWPGLRFERLRTIQSGIQRRFHLRQLLQFLQCLPTRS
jgi:hypothetical protein